jgi:ubiquinol-cytochrome c reductase cytochrome b subunit
LLDPAQVAQLHYYGGTKFKEGKMVKFVRDKVSKFTPAQRVELQQVILAVSAEAGLPYQKEADARDGAGIEAGRRALRDSVGCADCHAFRQPDPDATGPELTGWGSREWLVGFITDPTHERFYGQRNDRMPKFGVDGLLDPAAIGQLADWLRAEPKPGRP